MGYQSKWRTMEDLAAEDHHNCGAGDQNDDKEQSERWKERICLGKSGFPRKAVWVIRGLRKHHLAMQVGLRLFEKAIKNIKELVAWSPASLLRPLVPTARVRVVRKSVSQVLQSSGSQYDSKRMGRGCVTAGHIAEWGSGAVEQKKC